MRRTHLSILLAAGLALVATTALAAGPFEALGAGGGGWLYASAFSPVDPNEMIIGSDMMGVMRSTDFGESWLPWNEGLIPPDSDGSTYVQDLCIFEYGGVVRYYAATVGGIYQRFLGSGWANETDQYTQTFRDLAENGQMLTRSLAFSDIEFDGDHTLYAIAGTNRFTQSAIRGDGGILIYPGFFAWCNSWTNYPDLQPPLRSDISNNVPGYEDQQITVWRKDLAAGGGWQPWGSDCQFGAARDLSVRVVDGVRYIAITTRTGIYLHNNVEWLTLSDNAVVMGDFEIPGQFPVLSPPYYGYPETVLGDWNPVPTDEQVFGAWSVSITGDGRLYVAMQELHDNPDFVGGVYMYPSVASGEMSGWLYVGTDEPADLGYGLPHIDGRSLYEIGQDYNAVYHANRAHLIYLSVGEDSATGDHHLYLGCRSGAPTGVFRMVRPSTFMPWNADWQVMAVAHPWNDVHYGIDADGQVYDLDIGWQQFWGANLIHEIAVCPTDHRRVVGQMNGMLHTSSNGYKWDNKYSFGSDAAGWRTSGYNEMHTLDIEFDASGLLVEANGDCGMLYEDAVNDDHFHHIQVPSGYNNECSQVEISQNWNGNGRTIFFVQGEAVQGGRDNHLFRFGTGDPVEIPVEITVDGVLLTDMFFRDLEMAGPNLFYLIVEDAIWNGTGKKAVYEGVHDPNTGSWTWAEVGEGTMPTPPTCLEYDSGHDRLFAGTGAGIFMLDSGDVDWTLVRATDVSGSGTDIDGDGAADVGAIREILLLPSGDRLFGVSNQHGGEGRLFTATGLAASDPQLWQWTVVDNPVDLPGTETWFEALEVYPTKPWEVFVGSRATADDTKNGVWKADLNTGTWTYLMADDPYYGVGVNAIRFQPGTANMLYVATVGYEVLRKNIKVIVHDPPPSPFELRITQGLAESGQEGIAIRFALPNRGEVDIEVFDVRGRRVRSLNAGVLARGVQTVHWDATDSDGRRCASGTYLLRVRAGSATGAGKVTLIR